MGERKKGAGIVFSALFAALIGVMCFFRIPLPSGIPIVLQDTMALFAGAVLGPLYGGLSVLLFIVLGCLGLPVFSGKGGFHVIVAGPTGGFIIGYLLASITTGLILLFLLPQSDRGKNIRSYVFIFLSGVVGAIVIYICGVVGFMIIVSKSFMEAVAVCVLPFIPGQTIKLIIFTLLTKSIRPLVRSYIWS